MSKLITKKTNSPEEWLEERRKSIGGSDAAAIINCNNYCSPYNVWADKLGMIPPKEPTLAMKLGIALEPTVAEFFEEETGKKVRNRNGTIRNPDYPFAHANVDRWIVGENAGLECKTTRALNLKRFKDGLYPEEYFVQCMHYMAVTGAEKYYLAVLILGDEKFFVFEIDRDEEFIDFLMQQEREFWEYVETNTAPEVDGTESTKEAQQYRFSDVNDDEINLECEELLSKRSALKSQQKELSQEIELIDQQIKEEMGNAQTGLTSKYKVSWKQQTRKKFDDKRFIKEHKDMDFSDYYKESKFRALRVSELKK